MTEWVYVQFICPLSEGPGEEAVDWQGAEMRVSRQAWRCEWRVRH